MKRFQISQVRHFLTIAVIILLLIFSVFFLMTHVQQLLNSDLQINLTEVITQNKDVIISKLMLEVNELHLMSKQIADRLPENAVSDDRVIKESFLNYLKEKNEDNIFLADSEGKAFFMDGKEVDISGRVYFLSSSKGMRTISDRIVSRADGSDVFVISVPIIFNNKIVGTVQKEYSTPEMYALCKISLFSEQGYMYIINRQGYILITSKNDGHSRESDNYFRMLYIDNASQSRQLEDDIKNDRAGFMEAVVDGERVFSVYTPIEDIYDWYLIASINTKAVSPNTSVVIKLFYFILFVVVILFGVIISYLGYYKHMNQKKLEKIAFVDTVTGGHTFNRFIVHLNEVLSLNDKLKKQFHIMVVDIDNFKYINNFYGFGFGDKVLKEINNILVKQLSSSELIARIYSDHFVLLIEDASLDRLNSIFDSIGLIENIKIYVHAGVYTISDTSESVNLMVDKANIAGKSVKGMRNKRYCYYIDQFEHEMIKNEETTRKIEKALADNLFEPFFQPKIDINTHKLIGAEALARMRMPDGELIPPCDFIPVSESSGLIVAIDMAIFEKTLMFLKKNLDEGVHCVPISVNFSRLHLSDENFINQIVEKLEKYDVPSALVELELTESAMFEDSNIVGKFIDQIHRCGLSISMDDFGSGYSSLNMLKDIPIDVLKIDSGFLKGSQHGDRQKVIFSAISQLAKGLNIQVVVEGVETLLNVELMRESNFSVAQGYYYSKPLEQERFSKIYKEGMI